MTYSPGSPGSSPYGAQPSGSYGAPTPAYGQPAVDSGPSKLPLYLTAAVAAFGILAYLFSFGPMFTFNVDIGPFGTELSGTGGFGTQIAVVAALAAALLAGASLLPKATGYSAIVAVLAVLGVLLVAYQVFVKPQGVSIGWGLWVVLAMSFLQAVVAIGAVLLETGVLTAPAPRPKYEQPQYGQYGPPAGYWGQTPGQPQHQQQQPAGPPQGPRPGYPSQYPGYQQGPSTGGFGAVGPQGGAQSGPPTPPTGYPSFSPPPAVGSGQQQAPAQSSGQNQPQSPAPSPGPSSS
ncbi:DUF5336 domain-containing protein [Mycolicibacterium komossense]|uniref:DUF5336 domain-containing protein n=1 Tax=Mycolicibacterium komossense TaxID=1779 RepID=A0ABT3CE53_9MYCO|nr:DUF5336 domain-containing protein [Mycolicibacterium komossense]MCV7227750.1 DUF5336 domain-containing protein [Mycolicibacterium komossense]